MNAIAKDRVGQVLAKLAEDAVVWVPARKTGGTEFTSFAAAIEPDFTTHAARSPKAVLLPSVEKVYRYDLQGCEATVTPLVDSGKTVLFGVRSCDMAAIDMLDDIFLGGVSCDANYAQRRKKCVIFALACTQPEKNCFCASMGVDPLNSMTADIQLLDLGDVFGLLVRSEAGQAVVEGLASAGLLEVKDVEAPSPIGNFYREVDTAGVPEKMGRMFAHEIWDDLGRKCLGCGACAYVCPVCHCFDLVDAKKNAYSGYKLRIWDNCMSCGYTLMAGGHNPRPGRRERMRQRFMHKLCYGPKNQGKLLCTGCGRCLSVCPVNIEITGVIDQVKEAVVDG